MGTIRAAVHEIAPAERVSARAAFSALTRGAWRLLGAPDRGVLAVGADATFVRWAVDDLVVEANPMNASATGRRIHGPQPWPAAAGSRRRLPTARSVWRHGVEG